MLRYIIYALLFKDFHFIFCFLIALHRHCFFPLCFCYFSLWYSMIFSVSSIYVILEAQQTKSCTCRVPRPSLQLGPCSCPLPSPQWLSRKPLATALGSSVRLPPPHISPAAAAPRVRSPVLLRGGSCGSSLAIWHGSLQDGGRDRQAVNSPHSRWSLGRLAVMPGLLLV